MCAAGLCAACVIDWLSVAYAAHNPTVRMPAIVKHYHAHHALPRVVTREPNTPRARHCRSACTSIFRLTCQGAGSLPKEGSLCFWLDPRASIEDCASVIINTVYPDRGRDPRPGPQNQYSVFSLLYFRE
jgi:hypothetical protein